MCTASWIRHDTGYQLFFNRDEKLTRRKALPPRLTGHNGVRYLAPVDGDFGGTWIAANEFGVSISLLNGANLTGVRSRGLVVPELISAPSVAGVRDLVNTTDFAGFAPFTVVALEPGHPAALFEWDGSRKTFRFQDERCSMLTSSSFDTEAVRASRKKEFHGVVKSCRQVDADLLADLLAKFHASHVPARSAYSTCMHRADAETVSFSRIRVSERKTDFFYSPAAPCLGVLKDPPLVLRFLRNSEASVLPR
jgi:hypothetical protein